MGLFDLSMFKENNVSRFFECLDLTQQETNNIGKSIAKRNIYAHPRGRVLIIDSGKLDDILGNNISAIKNLHEKMGEIVFGLFLNFIKDNFSDIEGDVEEIDRFSLEIKHESNEENIRQIKNQIDYLRKSIEDKFENALFLTNYFNKKDIESIILGINNLFDKYEQYKNIFNFFKLIFSSEH